MPLHIPKGKNASSDFFAAHVHYMAALFMPPRDQLKQLSQEKREWWGNMLSGFVVPFAYLSAAQSVAASCCWLPYRTISVNEMVKMPDRAKDEWDAYFSHYHRDNWPNIRGRMTESVLHYDIDDETKEAFREALAAHDYKLYRCPPCVLFPALEREMRKHFADPGKKEAFKKKLVAWASAVHLPCGTGSHPFGHVIFSKLVRHVYESPNTKEDKERYRPDSTPMRHMLMHGHMAYNTYKSSMNMLVLADYVFEILHQAFPITPMDA